MDVTTILRPGLGALAALALAAPALAEDAAPAPCLAGGPFDAALVALEAEGWTVHPVGEPIPDDAADRLGWGLVATYVASDTGGEDLATLHALQRRAVEGLARKRDTLTSRARVLVREGGAMTIARTTTLPDRVEQTCRVSLDGLAAVRAETGFGPATSETDGDTTIVVTPLDPDVLSTLTGRATAVATLIETRVILSEEEAQ